MFSGNKTPKLDDEKDLNKKLFSLFIEASKTTDDETRQFLLSAACADESCLLNMILKADPKEVTAALNKQQDESDLCKALNQFREEFTKLSLSEKIYNPEHLFKSFELYDNYFKKFGGCDYWDKRDLFWRQIIGFVQRFFPANIAQDVAQGRCYGDEQNEKSNRSFNLKSGGNSIYPLTSSANSGLGFDHALVAGEERVRLGAGRAGARGFSFVKTILNSCRAKVSSMEKLYDRVMSRLLKTTP